jgi:hypothetical protein
MEIRTTNLFRRLVVLKLLTIPGSRHKVRITHDLSTTCWKKRFHVLAAFHTPFGQGVREIPVTCNPLEGKLLIEKVLLKVRDLHRRADRVKPNVAFFLMSIAS